MVHGVVGTIQPFGNIGRRYDARGEAHSTSEIRRYFRRVVHINPFSANHDTYPSERYGRFLLHIDKAATQLA
jgi:hypothetical protein